MNKEPVAIVAFIRVLLYAAITFGLSMSQEQVLAIIAVVEAGSALFVRSQVWSKDSVDNLVDI